MIKRYLFIYLFMALLPVLTYPENPGKETASSHSEILSATQVPPQVFVGDKARLVLTLVPKGSSAPRTLVIDVEDKLPQSKSIHITRIELDTHGKNPKMIVDFVPFEPGAILLPTLEIGPYVISRQIVDVASVLEADHGGLETAPPEETLLIPGTRLLLYGTIGFLFVLVLGLFAFLMWGSAWYAQLQAWFKKRQILGNLKKSLDYLEREKKEYSPVKIGELISYLRLYAEMQTGIPCVAKTGREIEAQADLFPNPEQALSLGHIIRQSDMMRYSGKTVTALEFEQLSLDIKKLVILLQSKVKGERGQ
ncbi:MAG: hypothetical protein LDL24_01510 [Treponema sp.]|nr:hypothetical protein [Treponema sp.]